jgi:hypothetical protein
MRLFQQLPGGAEQNHGLFSNDGQSRGAKIQTRDLPNTKRVTTTQMRHSVKSDKKRATGFNSIDRKKLTDLEILQTSYELNMMHTACSLADHIN